MHRLPIALAALALLATSGAAAADAQAAPSAGHHDGVARRLHFSSYVAMGDSYSATGIPPLDPGPGGTECGRSDATYSHLIADRLGIDHFRDVACGGADTSDYTHHQHSDIPPQLAALRPSTRLVTMTIGGNDQGLFSSAFTSCTYASVASYNSTGSIDGAPCRAIYGSSFRKTVQHVTYPDVLEALRAVRARAPRATVAILGYPTILPPEGVPSCYPRVPLSMGDVPYLGRLQRTLNRALARAADKTGVRFVDTARLARGHDACQPVGTRYIEPVTGNVSTALHPNVLGHQVLAAKTLKVLAR